MNRTAHFEYVLPHKYLIIKQMLWIAVFVYSCQLQQLQDLNFTNDERVLLKMNCLINNFAIQVHCLRGTAVSVKHMRHCKYM